MEKTHQPDFTQRLREAGFKVTPGRIELLRVLWRAREPLTVAEVGERLGKSLNEATVYRALEALSQKGIVNRVDLQHGHAHYELQKKHHHHIVCTDCGVVEDVDTCLMQTLQKNATARSKRFTSIYAHEVAFFGRCVKCD